LKGGGKWWSAVGGLWENWNRKTGSGKSGSPCQNDEAVSSRLFLAPPGVFHLHLIVFLRQNPSTHPPTVPPPTTDIRLTNNAAISPNSPPLPASFGQIDVSQPTLEIAVGGQRAAGQKKGKKQEARRRILAKKPGKAALGYAKTGEKKTESRKES